MANKIFFELFPSDAVASGVAIETKNKKTSLAGLFLPRTLGFFGQYDVAKTGVIDNVPVTIESADDAAGKFGFGSMLHRQAIAIYAQKTVTFTVKAIPVPPGGSAVKATGSIVITGSPTTNGVFSLYIDGIKVEIVALTTMAQPDLNHAFVAAINANVNLPVVAIENGPGTNEIQSKDPGVEGNNIDMRFSWDSTSETEAQPEGVSVAITQLNGGLVNPDITTAITNLGEDWYTEIAMPFNDATNLTLLKNAAATRFGPTVKKPFQFFLGSTRNNADQKVYTKAENNKFETSVPIENSPTWEVEISAESAAIVSNSAVLDPARPFKTLPFINAKAGFEVDGNQYNDRDALEKEGSAVTVIDITRTVRIYDFVTTYTENAQGAADDAYRWSVTMSNIQAKMYSVNTVFLSAPYDRAIIVDDDAITAKPYAVRPKTVRASLRSLVDDLWAAQAWSKNRDSIVASIDAEIDAGNGGRINAQINDSIALGGRIFAIAYNFIV